MEKINIDTGKIKENGLDVCKLSNELGVKIDELFEVLCNMEKNSIWIGKSATAFINSCKLEKKQYKNLASSLYNEGKLLQTIAVSYENTSNNLKG